MASVTTIYPSVAKQPETISNVADNQSYQRDRANHTGTQPISTIEDLESSLDAKFTRFGGVYFAEDYATGDGAVDDLTALHALRDLAGANAVIYLGGRTKSYRISGVLTLNVAGQQWVGDYATIKPTDGFTGSQVVYGSASGGGEIRTCIIDGNGKAADLLRGGGGWALNDNQLSNGTEYGITIGSVGNVSASRNKISVVGKSGIRVQNFESIASLRKILIEDNDIDLSDQGIGSTNVGILVRGESNANPTTGVTIRGGTITLTSSPTAGGHLGIETRFVDGGFVTGVEVIGGAMHTSLAGAKNMTVTGNVAKGQNFYAFEIASPGVSDVTEGNTVQGNIIDGQGLLKTGVAVQGVGTCRHNTVGPNVTRGVIDQGIYVHTTVTDLTIHAGSMDLSQADYGIYVNNADNVSIHCGNMDGGGVCKKGVYLVDANEVSIAGGVVDGMTENDIYLNVATAIDGISISGVALMSSIGAGNHIAYGGAGTLGHRVTAAAISGTYRSSSSYRLVAIHDLKADVIDVIGAGTPEANVVAGIGSTYIQTNGGAGTSRYIKESGTSNTGWVGK